jgi:acyl carrier protein
MSGLRDCVADAVDRYISERLKHLGKSPAALSSSEDLFGEGVLDSVALTGLIAAVESAIEREIDFIDVDPEALGTRNGIVNELSRAAGL